MPCVAYLAPLRLARGVDAHPRGTTPGTQRGAAKRQRGGKMEELQLESGILAIARPAFCFSSSTTHLRRFRAFNAPASGVEMGRRRRGTNGPGRESPTFRTGGNSAILPFRSAPRVPRGTGESPDGGGRRRATLKSGTLDTRNHRRWGDDERKTKGRPADP